MRRNKEALRGHHYGESSHLFWETSRPDCLSEVHVHWHMHGEHTGEITRFARHRVTLYHLQRCHGWILALQEGQAGKAGRGFALHVPEQGH